MLPVNQVTQKCLVSQLAHRVFQGLKRKLLVRRQQRCTRRSTLKKLSLICSSLLRWKQLTCNRKNSLKMKRYGDKYISHSFSCWNYKVIGNDLLRNEASNCTRTFSKVVYEQKAELHQQKDIELYKQLSKLMSWISTSVCNLIVCFFPFQIRRQILFSIYFHSRTKFLI